VQASPPVSTDSQPSNSLLRRLSLLTIISTATLTLILSILGGVLSTIYLRQDVGNNFETRADGLMERLNHEVYSSWREIQVAAQNQTFINPYTPINQQRAFLEAVQSGFEVYSWIGFADSEGVVHVSTDGLLEGEDVSTQPWFANGIRAPYIGELHGDAALESLLPRTGNAPIQFLDIAMPVYRDGEWVGVLGAHLNWAWLSDVIRASNQNNTSILPEDHADVFILNQDGYVIMDSLPLSKAVVSVPYALNLSEIIFLDDVTSASGTLNWDDGKTYIVGIAQSHAHLDFPGLGYRLILRQPEAEALAPAHHLQLILILTGVGIALLFTLINFTSIRAIVRPLGDMALSVNRIRAGETKVVIPVGSSNDEVKILGRALQESFDALNQRNSDLHDLNESLERRIEERTSAVERRARELANEIATRKQLETALTESRESFRRLADTSLDGIAISVDGVIIYSNNALVELFGYKQFELVRMTETAFVAPENSHIVQDIFNIGDQRLHEVMGVHKDGHRFPLEISGRTMKYSGAMAHVLTMREISGRKRTEAEIQTLYMLGQRRLEDVQKLNETLEYRSSHDHLTHLANRQSLEHHLQSVLNEAPLRGRGVAVIFIDLDHFKDINDMLGHSAGDLLLQMAANRMRASTEEVGLLARMGGDEFALVLSMVQRRAEAVTVAENIMKAVSEEPYTLRGREVKITASIGISYYPEHGHTVENLLRKADIALYTAKDEGRNTYRQADESTEIDLLSQMQLEIDLRNALQRGQMEIHYQPQFTLHDERIMGFEALLRWHHPTLGDISPARFIPVAEASDLILSIGAWVMKQATLQAKAWHDLGYPVNVAVNVSPRQFESPDFVASVKETLLTSGIPPATLELEVTEGLLIRDIEAKAATLEQLAAHGVRIAIDDFGTGFSSLSYLQKLPIHTLKIDQSFIANISDDDPVAKSTATAIIRAVSQMAHSLGIMVVAEGVETALQISVLRLLEADALQGYLLGRPMPAQAALELLQRDKPDS